MAGLASKNLKGNIKIYTPRKISMEPKNDGFEDVFPTEMVTISVGNTSSKPLFSGSMLIFGGVPGDSSFVTFLKGWWVHVTLKKGVFFGDQPNVLGMKLGHGDWITW